MPQHKSTQEFIIICHGCHVFKPHHHHENLRWYPELTTVLVCNKHLQYDEVMKWLKTHHLRCKGKEDGQLLPSWNLNSEIWSDLFAFKNADTKRYRKYAKRKHTGTITHKHRAGLCMNTEPEVSILTHRSTAIKKMLFHSVADF